MEVIKGMNGRAYEHFDDKSVVDSDASTDEEGDADEEKQKGSNNGLHLLPKVVKSSSYNTSSRDLPDCGIDNDLSNAKLFERQQEKDDVAMPDVGPDTQVAVEAMEALAQCLPAETLPAKDQAPLDRMMRDAVSKTVTSQSKNGPPQKRTSSIQEGVTTRSKRRKLPESNLKPRKERLTELKMQENSELMGKTKRKQTKSVPEKGQVLSTFPDENEYHGTPVAHRTRHSGRKNLCEYTELCSNKRLRKGNRETGDCSSIGEVQNNHITNGEQPIHCERISKSVQHLQSSRNGSTQHNNGNNIQNLEPCRGEKTTNVAFRESLSHSKQKRTPTAMVQSKLTAVTQTAADHEVPSEVPRQSKKKRVFVRSVSDLLKYAKREPSSGRSTSMLSSIIGKSLAGSPILSSSILSRLGVREAFSISDATHFVADSFYRTKNMLEAIALGKPVITSMWLENCREAGFYIDERKYILRDVKKEKDFGFSMPVSLASACKHPLLLGKRVFITPKVKPSREVMISLVKASSGKPLERVGRSIMKETTAPDDLLVISCEEDYQTCAPLLERGVSVFNSELLLNGIIIQKLEYESIRILKKNVPATRFSFDVGSASFLCRITSSMKINVDVVLLKNLNITVMELAMKRDAFREHQWWCSKGNLIQRCGDIGMQRKGVPRS
ncbi:hypothetical protein PR202_gb24900 [Eleusine coracana subsp. coracana]|uniref:BRCT domain-containing protein n=1 Tax=Eleusine coracana subsp. coracana TaxID=191504 RepID=A0AAV5FJW9_ELECO|nr:hypothetical protein PR202_gb24900 [Eleusine coracana subsp. coracana]